jgi:periplasmic protein TonB
MLLQALSPVPLGVGPASSGEPPLTVRLETAEAPAAPLRAVPRPRPGAARTDKPAAAPAPAPAPAAVLPVPLAGYYRSSELEVRPQISLPANPVYPEAAKKDRLSGRVVLRLLVDESGSLDDLAAVEKEGGELFADAALQAFAKARITPGRLAGAPVKAQMYLEVHFDADGTVRGGAAGASTAGDEGGPKGHQGPAPWRYRHWNRKGS